jgi:hypothetical protein
MVHNTCYTTHCVTFPCRCCIMYNVKYVYFDHEKVNSHVNVHIIKGKFAEIEKTPGCWALLHSAYISHTTEL